MAHGKRSWHGVSWLGIMAGYHGWVSWHGVSWLGLFFVREGGAEGTAWQVKGLEKELAGASKGASAAGESGAKVKELQKQVKVGCRVQ